ncbi:MAG: hypothetical protein ACK4OK_04360, partial [Thermoflexus sp.]
LSVVYDLLYITSYLVILNGLYLRWALPLPSIRTEEVLASIPSVRPRETLVLLSDLGGRILFVDPRFPPAQGIPDVGRFAGEFVGTALGLQTGLDVKILQEVRTQGYSQPRKTVLNGQLYSLQAVMEEEPDPAIYWLLTPWDARLDIQHEEKPSLEVLLARAVRGTIEKPSPAELTRAYLEAVLSLLSVMCARFCGRELGQRFPSPSGPELTACWEALHSGRPDMMEKCQELLQGALERVLLLVPADVVKKALAQLEAGLGEEIVQAAAASGLRLSL